MNTTEIRQAFLDYFASHGHEIVPSSSLIPGNDPTLLFTNAGMVQFKDVFLGRDPRGYTRAASSQRCVRAGGKHNDLENVGYTARHHTFFEMLGNFSFGDYFKEDAIRFAWEFLTGVLKLPREKLWVTVFHEDSEAEAIWINQMGVDPARLSRLGEKSNFWQMGDTGPCGPCTEIFYDHGEDVWGGPPGSPEEDGDRYIEVWNLVFMQYDRQPDGRLVPLPKPSVDTGMGLERIAAVMQHVHSNYEIDLFSRLLSAVQAVTGATDAANKSLRVVADHIRSCAFLVADGVLPSNEGRGYVLRRIMRRAIRHGNSLGAREPFFYRLVAPLIAEMGNAYPELVAAQSRIEKVLLQEEQQFARTLEKGLRILEQALAGIDGQVIPGDVVFRLYDTYGFPADLTADIARERDMTIDEDGFEREMAIQRERSQKSGQFTAHYHDALDVNATTVFSGYERTSDDATVLELYVEGQRVESIEAGQQAAIVLDVTPFYAESGGQIGDCGVLGSETGRFEVIDTRKVRQAHVHHGRLVGGVLSVGDRVTATVEPELRQAIRLNHSATHLMHAALRRVLGPHVTQKGSLVTATRLRFDFAHAGPVTSAEISAIESLVNAQIRANTPVTTRLMDLESARKSGAMALFGEKYDADVRVLSMGEGDFSVELCGGTHVSRTGDIGVFRIVSEGGLAAGVRRIEAVTGAEALRVVGHRDRQLNAILDAVKGSEDTVAERVQGLLERVRHLEKELERQASKLAKRAGDDLLGQAMDVAGVKVLAASIDNVDGKTLREMVDKLRDQLGEAVILLGAVQEGKVNLVAGVSKALTAKVKAGDLVNHVALQVGGKGGGRPDMAMAGGSDPEQLPVAIGSVRDWVSQRLSGG